VSFSEWWSPGSKAEAALDADIANLLWNDAEKRRKNAWLRKVGFVTRIMAYASIFGVMFVFMPDSIRTGWITTKPFSQLTLGDVLTALAWVLVGLKLAHSLFHPNPRPDFQETWGWLGVAIFGLLALTGLALYLFH